MGYFYDDLTDHPDALVLDVAGKEVDWLLNKRAFELGAEEDIDFAEFEDLAEDDVQGSLDALSALLYVGTLPFADEGQETPTREDFDQVITPRTAAEIGPQVMKQFQGLTDEEIDAAVGKE